VAAQNRSPEAAGLLMPGRPGEETGIVLLSCYAASLNKV
jgi:hypothetical protein